MDKTIIIGAAAKATAGLDSLQLISTVVIGIAAVGVPAAFAWMDRRSKADDVKRRARSFALAHYGDFLLLRDHLLPNTNQNVAGQPVTSHAAIQSALLGPRNTTVPVADLYLLGEAAAPVQRAFALIRKAEAYSLRRDMYAQQMRDIVQLDMEQAAALRKAHEELVEGMRLIDQLLK